MGGQEKRKQDDTKSQKQDKHEHEQHQGDQHAQGHKHDEQKKRGWHQHDERDAKSQKQENHWQGKNDQWGGHGWRRQSWGGWRAGGGGWQSRGGWRAGGDEGGQAKWRKEDGDNKGKRAEDPPKQSCKPKGADHLGHYGALGLQPWCSEKDIKVAYQDLAKKCHPDKVKGEPETVAKAMSTLFVKATEARRVLQDASLRAAYDAACWGPGGRPAPPLPEGWSAHLSKTTGKVYFHNSKTNENTYDLPTRAA